MEAAIEFGSIFGDDEVVVEEDLDYTPSAPATQRLTLLPAFTPESATPWPTGLVFDLALGLDDTGTILDRYDVTPALYEQFLSIPAFRRELSTQVRKNQDEGVTFQRRAQAVAEECLPDVYALIKDPTVAASTRGDLWKYMVKAGNLEPKDKEKAGAGNGMAVQININLN